MRKVTAFIGTGRKKSTYDAVRVFLDRLESLEDVETEIVVLSEYRIEPCRGCKRCFNKGEEFCPLDDDRDLLIEKMMASDGVVFASPNYSYQVTGTMKLFLDRLGFMFHRPRFFGKSFTGIVVQGIYGGGKIVNYLDFVGMVMGFNTVRGYCFTALEPMTDAEVLKRDRAFGTLAERFAERGKRPAYPPPTLFKLMGFRMARTSMRLLLDENSRDYTYFRDRGWFESDYYYAIRLGPLKQAAGGLFDALGRAVVKRGGRRTNDGG